MKQLGPNLWYGEREMVHNYRLFRSWLDQKEQEEKAELERKTPSARYWHFARKDWDRPWKNIAGMKNYFRMQEYGLLELEWVKQKSFPDLKNCQDFLVQIRSIYVVDLHQGKGVGRKILDDIKEVSEKSCCAVILFVCPFGFDSGNGLEMGISSWEELERVAFQEEREIIYKPKSFTGSISEFYRKAGFQNICLRGPDSAPLEGEIDPTKYEFVYLPKTISREHKEQLGDRLRIQLSKYCQCDNELIG